MASPVHRLFEANGVESWIVDPASVAVPRRVRRARATSSTARRSCVQLLAFRRGEPRVCSMVHPTSLDDEDRRRLTRERRTLMTERIEHTNRIKGLLMSQGISGYDPLRKDRWSRLDELETRDGHPLPRRMRAEISREIERLELLARQLKQVEAERDALVSTAPEIADNPAILLMKQGSNRRTALRGLPPLGPRPQAPQSDQRLVQGPKRGGVRRARRTARARATPRSPKSAVRADRGERRQRSAPGGFGGHRFLPESAPCSLSLGLPRPSGMRPSRVPAQFRPQVR